MQMKKKKIKRVCYHSYALPLENYQGDIEIIAAVGKNSSSSDSLVRDKYVEMCRAIDFDPPDCISVFVNEID